MAKAHFDRYKELVEEVNAIDDFDSFIAIWIDDNLDEDFVQTYMEVHAARVMTMLAQVLVDPFFLVTNRMSEFYIGYRMGRESAYDELDKE